MLFQMNVSAYRKSLNRRSGMMAILLFCIVLLWSCQAGPNHGSPQNPEIKVLTWPQKDHDLLPDPDITFGQLENGLRFVIQENQTPRDRVSMHLFVQAGSLYERPEEQGVAHFIEHMLFNGTTHFPPGEMVKYFQRIGMQFGPDANAHTGLNQTVFDVVLPNGDEKSLAGGLLVLRDYADGALFLPEEVDREKKVILSEMRTRDSANFRTLKSNFKFEFPGLLFAQRFPGGERKTVEKMDHQMLRDFYDTWYRPERMILVLVGDLKKECAVNLIRKKFSNLKAKKPFRGEPDVGTMTHKGLKTYYHHEKETGSTKVSIETMVQNQRSLDSKEERMKEMVAELANNIVQNRLDALIQRPDAVWTSAYISSGSYLQQIKYTQIEADCQAREWSQALSELEQTLRKALTFGFSEAELQRVKKSYRAQLIRDVQAERTRNSKELASDILSDLSESRVIQSPQQRLDMLTPALEALTVKQVHEAFIRNWSEPHHRLVLVTGNADLSVVDRAAEKQIQQVYKQSNLVKLEPPAKRNQVDFPYLPLPQSPGIVADRKHIKALDITLLEFSNGFHLNLKKTPFKQNQIVVSLSFGGGQASEPQSLPGLAKITEPVINESGFGGMDWTERETALAGRLAKTSFEIREDMFVVTGEAASNELELLFQLLYTQISDPGFREDVRRLVLNRLHQEYKSMQHATDGLLQLEGIRFFAGGDRRFGAPPWDALQQRSLDQMSAWVKGQMLPAKMELSVVGDFDPDQAVKLAARYFGSLKKTEKNSKHVHAVDGSGPVFPKGKALKLSVQTEIPKTLVVVAFPTEDFWNIQRTRRLTVMGELFSERLRTQIREKLGAAYSPYAFNHSFRAYKGYGMLQVLVEVAPQEAEKIVKEIKQLSQEMASKKPDDDEFRRIIEPTLTQIKDYRQTNTYWLNSVLTGATRHPDQLDWSRTFQKDYASITAEEVADLAKRYLAPKNAATVIIEPDHFEKQTESVQ